MIDAEGVICLTLAMETFANPAERGESLEGVQGHELGGHGQQFLRSERAGQEAHALGQGLGRSLSAAAEDEDGNLGKAGVELSDKGRGRHAGHVRPSNDKAELAGKLRLLKHAKRLGRIGYPQHILKSFLKDGFAYGCLKRIIVHQ